MEVGALPREGWDLDDTSPRSRPGIMMLGALVGVGSRGEGGRSSVDAWAAAGDSPSESASNMKGPEVMSWVLLLCLVGEQDSSTVDDTGGRIESSVVFLRRMNSCTLNRTTRMLMLSVLPRV